MVHIPTIIYFMDPNKSILVIPEKNVSQGQTFQIQVLKIVTGRCYMGGYISATAAQTTWMG